jgi:hypothetical protein
MILTPGLIIMTIAATRMHRSLVDYASAFPDVYDTLLLLSLYPTQRGQYRFRVTVRENINLPITSALFSKTKRAQTALNSLHRIEVNVHTSYEQDTIAVTTQTNDHDSYNSTNDRVNEKPNAWGPQPGEDVERGI